MNTIKFNEGIKEITKDMLLDSKKVVLPSTIINIDARVFDETVEEIEISEKSELYYSINGALLTKNNTLIYLPKGREIPECASVIGSYSCRFLDKEYFVLPKNIEKIQSMGFAESKINSIICNDNLKKIGSNAFNSLNLDEGVKSIKLNDGLEEISDNAFQGTLLNEILIPKSVKNIGLTPFDIRGRLSSIEVDPKNTKYYSNNSNSIIEKETNRLIVGCKKTSIPDSVSEIGEKAFYSSNIKNVDIPESVKVIADYAFYNNKIKLIDISKVDSVGIGAFQNNADLESVILSNEMSTIPSYFVSGCDNLKEIKLPDSIELIQTDAFANFLGERIIIGSRVKTIETKAISSYNATILYKGTKEEWLKIIGNRNIYYDNFGKTPEPKEYIVECADGELKVSVF